VRAIQTKELLIAGIEHPDRTGVSVRYRFIQVHDSIADVTDMLHDAYRPLAEKGMRFVASHQDADETRQRTQKGDTIVAIDNNQIVGIVTLSDVATTRGCAFYDRDDVASFGQFAVRPSHQSRGIGSKLLDLVETLAHEKGVGELALDTSEHATDLIAMYQAKGFRFIEYVQWKRPNYRSIVFSKTLRVPTPDP
jgi:GNAT superfamily N-acetyltransferase